MRPQDWPGSTVDPHTAASFVAGGSCEGGASQLTQLEGCCTAEHVVSASVAASCCWRRLLLAAAGCCSAGVSQNSHLAQWAHKHSRLQRVNGATSGLCSRPSCHLPQRSCQRWHVCRNHSHRLLAPAGPSPWLAGCCPWLLLELGGQQGAQRAHRGQRASMQLPPCGSRHALWACSR